MNSSYFNSTTIHPIGLAVTALLMTSIFFLPRRRILSAFMVMSCFIPTAQRIVIGGFDFTLIRILVLSGWIRVLGRGEHRLDGGFNQLDRYILAWAVSTTIVFTLQSATFSRFIPLLVEYAGAGDAALPANLVQAGNRGVAGLINRVGVMFDSIGMYFLFRVLIRSRQDIDALVNHLVWISFPLVVFFLLEWTTGRNMFSIFGGVSAFSGVRLGKIRAQGPFTHPIIAGCFVASLLPLLVAELWNRRMNRMLVLSAIGCLTLVIISTASSTSLAALGCAFLGMAFLPLRRHMALIRKGLALMLVGLHLVMEKPVWHLISRIDLAGGSTGYHRYRLIDAAVRNFGDWFLIGVPDTRYWGAGLQDVTNQYVLEGVRGGLVTLVIFLLLIAAAFRCVGKAWRRNASARKDLVLAWSIGTSLFVHVMSFLAVSYFGVGIVAWYLTLALCGSAAARKEPFAADSPRRLAGTDALAAPAIGRLVEGSNA